MQRVNEEEHQKDKEEQGQEEEITTLGDLGPLLPAKDRIIRILIISRAVVVVGRAVHTKLLVGGSVKGGHNPPYKNSEYAGLSRFALPYFKMRASLFHKPYHSGISKDIESAKVDWKSGSLAISTYSIFRARSAANVR